MEPGRYRRPRPRRIGLPGASERHPQKITVYLTGSELLDLERARLSLRAMGLTVDRGRVVREALAILLADLDTGGDGSLVATRLREGAADAAGEGALQD